jgi:hypothetical protein
MIKIAPGQLMLATLLLQFVTVAPCPPDCSCDYENTNCSRMSLTAIPGNVDSNTTVINMSFNNITTLSNKDFVNLTQLEIILLDNNDISGLEPYVFHQTKKLICLNLSNNKIYVINSSLFKSLKQLRHLYLQNNIIHHIQPRLFEHNPHLVLLDISGNFIHNFEPNTFQNNLMLAWVNVSGNPLTLPLETTLFNNNFNILDIEFCDSTNSYISAFQKVPSVNLIGTEYTTVVNLDEFTSFQDAPGLDPNEIEYLRMKHFYRLNGFSFESIHTMTIGEELNVMSATGEDILCYCRYYRFWFWCAEQPQKRCENTTTKSEKYKILGCNTDTSDQKQANEYTSDTNKRKGLYLPDYLPVNWKTVRKTLLQAAVPVLIITLVIGAFIYRRVRLARKETESLSSYSKVET